MSGPGGGTSGPGSRPSRGPGAGPTHRFESSGEPSRKVEQVGPPPSSGPGKRRTLVLTAGVVALVLLAGIGIGLFVFGGDDGKKASTTPTTTSSVPADEQCTDAIMSNPRWVCLTSAIVADGKITIDFRGDGSPMNVNGGYHLHIYGDDPNSWYEEDRHPAVLDLADERYRTAIGDAAKVCARVAGADHRLVPDGAAVTGNCVSITRTEPSTTTTQDQPTRNKQPHTKRTTTSESTTTDSTTTDTTTTTEPSIVAPTGTRAP